MLKNLTDGLSKFQQQLDEVKTRKPKTLFPIEYNWHNLKEYRCPVSTCNNKLLKTQNGKNYYCKGKKHLDGEKIWLSVAKVEETRAKLELSTVLLDKRSTK